MIPSPLEPDASRGSPRPARTRRGRRLPGPVHQHLRRQSVLAGELWASGRPSRRSIAGPSRWREGRSAPDGFVVGDIGPTAAEEAGAAAEQAAVLIDSGVDALVFETYRAEPVLQVLREVQAALGAPVPILASLWQWPDPPERDRATAPGPGRHGRRDQLSAGHRRRRSRWPGVSIGSSRAPPRQAERIRRRAIRTRAPPRPRSPRRSPGSSNGTSG